MSKPDVVKGWNTIAHNTYAMVVPGGMIIRYEDIPPSEEAPSSQAMVFVPCTNPDLWIKGMKDE